ncbi:MAG: S-layer homology domain-containing protein [Bacillota bacterium]
MKGKVLSLLVLSLVFVLVFGSTAMAIPSWFDADEDDLSAGLAEFDEETLERHLEYWEAKFAEMRQRAMRHVAQAFGFEDMDEAPWALAYVTRARLMNLMVGRGPGSFAPNAPVKRAEVLTVAVRMLGEVDADDDLDDLEFDLSGAEWARGWLRAADDYELFENDENFRPNAAAKREWVAHVMLRVLDEADSDELDEADDDLDGLLDKLEDYPDYPAISSEYRDSLALALDLGIFGGYPDGTLRPRASISRAEFATVLSNMAELLDISTDWEDDQAGMLHVEGDILEVDDDDKWIEINPLGEEDEAVYDLDSDVEVWLRYGFTEHLAELDDLRAGDRVDMYYRPGGDVEYIFARATLETVAGTLDELELPEEDDDGEIEIFVEGDEEDFEEFELKEWTSLNWNHSPQYGDLVTLKVRDDVALEVTIEPSEEFPASFGILDELDIDDDDGEFTLSIIDEDDNELDFEGDLDELEVILDGEDADLEYILPGYEVELRTDGEDGPVVDIVADRVSGTFVGEFIEYDDDDATLEIEVDDESMYFLVDGEYGLSSEDAYGWDFKSDDQVELTYDGYFVVSIEEAE